MNIYWETAILLQWALLVIMAVLVAGVYRLLGSLQHEAHRPPRLGLKYAVGDGIDGFSVSDVAGSRIDTGDFSRGDGKNMLLFLSSTCSGCRIALSQVDELASRGGAIAASGWQVYLIFEDSPAAVHGMEQQYKQVVREGGVTIFVDSDGAIARPVRCQKCAHGHRYRQRVEDFRPVAQPAR